MPCSAKKAPSIFSVNHHDRMWRPGQEKGVVIMAVREVPAEEITKTIKRLCMEASTILGDDVIEAFKRGYEREESPVGKHVLWRAT